MPSFGEIIIILIIAILVIKPEDIPEIAKFLKSIIKYISGVKKDIYNKLEFTEQFNISKHDLIDHVDEINFYLSKISDLGKRFDGEYKLEDIRKFYYKSVKDVKSEDQTKLNQ